LSSPTKPLRYRKKRYKYNFIAFSHYKLTGGIRHAQRKPTSLVHTIGFAYFAGLAKWISDINPSTIGWQIAAIGMPKKTRFQSSQY